MSIDIDPETNPFGSGVDNPGADETGERFPMTSSRRGSVDPTGLHKTYKETSFGGNISDTTPLLGREERVDTAWERIKREFPNFNPTNSSFTASIDEYDRVIVKLQRFEGRPTPLFKADGEINNKLPKTIKDSLGPPAEEIVETNNRKIVRHQEKNI